jgi:hypothetical protein
MTTRRSFLALVGAGAAAGLVGCRESATRTAVDVDGVPDVVVAGSGPDLVAVRGSRLDRYRSAILSAGADHIYRSEFVGPDTDVIAVSTRAGTESVSRLNGRWEPRIASGARSLVAFTPPSFGSASGTPISGPRTPIVVFDGRAEVARFEPAGNYAPDAFSLTGTTLFVLDWLPANAPEHYRVRQIDLGTGEPTPLLTRDKVLIPLGAEELMSGEARAGVYSPNLEVLYTLYTHQPDHTHTRDLLAGRQSEVHAFVHTLQLAQNWAYCIDLPEPFGAGPAAAHAIAVAPDGGTLYVVDVSSGRLAVIDPSTLGVSAVKELPSVDGSAVAAFAAVTTRYLFVGAGDEVLAIDRRDYRPAATRRVAGPIVGVGVDPSGWRLCIAGRDSLLWTDVDTGAVLGQLPVPGLTSLRAIV